ncbi:hypothetical protein ADK60_13605 [Streptomyces sp. XY431]|uniref:DUF4240 domain-containing protein n=1 Tax=Streptomyces sp. XY431 TaxID=1415562 RepID=UPI0006AF318E|nr:DUF4240 domain-containing protein [Streptomyces sp. XY431]KOV32481.1 hypothetical protein ADK60_13605 [Streptomyces sp. XY431]
MDTQQFWKLIEEARSQVPAPANGDAVVERATALLALRPAEEIVAAQQILRGLMADSYRAPLWGAAYVINGGCSDDGFDYFRGWLITQGRGTFDRAITDPDALTELPAVRASAPEWDFEDGDELSRRLPRLTELYAEPGRVDAAARL